MPDFSPTCRQHPDERRLANALRLGGFADPSAVHTLKQAEHTCDRRALGRMLELWDDPQQRLAPLQRRDLLGAGLALELPNALTEWMRAGESFHADTLLAFVLIHTQTPPAAAVWKLVADSVTLGPCKTWAGVMMGHVLRAGWTQQAQDLLRMGVDAGVGIPSRALDAHDWLWTHDALEQNEENSTTALHLALRLGQWEMAETLVRSGVPIDLVDGRGVRPVNEVNDFLKEHESMQAMWPSARRDDDTAQAAAWRDRLIASERGLELDQALGTVEETTESQGRRRL